jgi:hypothetical protein
MTPWPWAKVSGWLGVVANLLLIAFYALAQPWQSGPRPFEWVGTVNDVAVAAQFAALIPFALLWRPDRRSTLLAIASMAAVVVLQLALIIRILTFDVEGGFVVFFLLITFVWFAITGGSLVARLIGVGLVVGALMVGLSFLLPKGSAADYLALGSGGTLGGAAWLAFPIWLLVGGWDKTRQGEVKG